MITRRELIEAQRDAFIKGANWRLDLHNNSGCHCRTHDTYWPGSCTDEAEKYYPLTVKRPRVFETGSYRYRVREGKVEYQNISEPEQWRVDATFKPELIRALAALLGEPTEDVAL